MNEPVQETFIKEYSQAIPCNLSKCELRQANSLMRFILEFLIMLTEKKQEKTNNFKNFFSKKV